MDIPEDFDAQLAHLLEEDLRPGDDSKHPEQTQAHFCSWVAAMSQYVYMPAYVQERVELLSTEEGCYQAVVGSTPRRKVTQLSTAKMARGRCVFFGMIANGRGPEADHQPPTGSPIHTVSPQARRRAYCLLGSG